MIELPELPYARGALEPNISKKTIDFHYGKHHKGYVDNLNKLIEGTEYEEMDLDHIVKGASGPIYNNAAQVWNHTFFWKCMKPSAKPLDPKMKVAKGLERYFGGYDKFREKFTDEAKKLFGAGWVWLVVDKGEPKIKQMKNADEPLSKGMDPILVCDVWEHSYYLDYQNDRAKYIEAFFALIDWEFVEHNWEAV